MKVPKKLNGVAFRIYRKNSGFTLVEVLVTMGLASVVSMGLMSMVDYNVRAQKGISQSLAWTSIQGELVRILNTQSLCVKMFNDGGFFIAGPTAQDPAVMIGQPISIPRSSTAVANTSGSFYTNYVEPGPSSGGIKFTSVSIFDAVPTSGSAFKVTVRINAEKTENNTTRAALGMQTYSSDTAVYVTTSGPTHKVVQCGANMSDQLTQEACESAGGVWSTTTYPQCTLISPNPLVTPASPATQNLCPVGTAVSGIDLSSGTAVAQCTTSNPGPSLSCPNGALTWDGTSFNCSTLVHCTQGQYAYFDTSTSTYTCATIPNCGPGNHLVGNGATAAPTCYPDPPTPATSCLGNNFLQWTAPSGSNPYGTYSCGTFTSAFPQCPDGQFLTWDGATFSCAAPDGNSTAPSCSAGQFLVYSTATGRFGCSGFIAPGLPGSDCNPSSNNFLGYNYNSKTFTCTNLDVPRLSANNTFTGKNTFSTPVGTATTFYGRSEFYGWALFAAGGNGSGLEIGWNMTGNDGETDLWNFGQAGSGGFRFLNSSGSQASPTNYTSSPNTTLMKIDSAGNTTVTGVLTVNGDSGGNVPHACYPKADSMAASNGTNSDGNDTSYAFIICNNPGEYAVAANGYCHKGKSLEGISVINAMPLFTTGLAAITCLGHNATTIEATIFCCKI